MAGVRKGAGHASLTTLRVPAATPCIPEDDHVATVTEDEVEVVAADAIAAPPAFVHPPLVTGMCDGAVVHSDGHAVAGCSH